MPVGIFHVASRSKSAWPGTRKGNVTPSEIAAFGGVAVAMILAFVAWWLLGRAEQAELRKKKERGSQRT